jgi:hypothetical protein
LNDLKENLKLFRPEVGIAFDPYQIDLMSIDKYFPAVYQYTTYGLCVLLKHLWNQAHDLIKNNSGRPSPHQVELCSAVERSIAYAHTGNAKVIATSLMGPLWLSHSLLNDGLPTLSRDIVRIISGDSVEVLIHTHLWPINGQYKIPVIASKKSQILTYGLEHYTVHLNVTFHSKSPLMATFYRLTRPNSVFSKF